MDFAAKAQPLLRFWEEWLDGREIRLSISMTMTY